VAHFVAPNELKQGKFVAESRLFLNFRLADPPN